MDYLGRVHSPGKCAMSYLLVQCCDGWLGGVRSNTCVIWMSRSSQCGCARCAIMLITKKLWATAASSTVFFFLMADTVIPLPAPQQVPRVINFPATGGSTP